MLKAPALHQYIRSQNKRNALMKSRMLFLTVAIGVSLVQLFLILLYETGMSDTVAITSVTIIDVNATDALGSGGPRIRAVTTNGGVRINVQIGVDIV
jgi:hypothetical protein